MKQYLELGREIIAKYDKTQSIRQDRTNTGTVSLFGRQIRFDLSEGFPLVTTKKVFLRGIIEELLWMLAGDTNNNTLLDKNVHIWDEWAVQDKVTRELNVSEREELWVEKLKAEGYTGYRIAPANASNADFKQEHDDGKMVVLSDQSMDELFDAEGIPRSIEERGPMDGDLGPIYGSQWRSWPNYREVETRRYTINQRYQLALETAETDQQKLKLQAMARHYGLMPGVAPLEERCVTDHQKGTLMVAHSELDTFGIPRTYTHVGTIDQISELIQNLKTRPYSRRHIVTAWNVADLPNESISPQDNVREGRAALSSCHTLFQFYVRDMDIHERGAIAGIDTSAFTGDELSAVALQRRMDKEGIPKHKLDCQLYQRSADYCLGVPFNIASYALLTMMIAQCVGMVPGEFVHTFGDVHIYKNHIQKFRDEQLTREPHPLPTMWINPEKTDIFSFTIDDFKLQNYVSHDKIDYGGVAV